MSIESYLFIRLAEGAKATELVGGVS